MNPDQLHGAGFLVWTPVIGNFVLAAWAFVVSRRGRRTLPPAFWAVLLVVLVIVVLQAVPGILLFIAGARPRRALHLLYGVLVLLGGAAQYGLRPGGVLRRRVEPTPGAFREPLWLSLLCLTEGGLIMRAWQTGHG